MRLFLILVLLGIGSLCFFGKNQPVVVINNPAARPAPCSKCGGGGSVEIQADCPKCGGSGKGEWALKLRAQKKINESKPMCLNCRGTGKVTRFEKCPECNGTGRAKGAAPRTKTIRAELSLLEKMFASVFQVKPDANCRPQRRMDGSYPLIVKYVETMVSPAYNARVVKWEKARLEGREWIVQAVLEFKDSAGRPAMESREFIIENREVKGTRKVF
jgi:hypothetical protein